MIEIVRNVPAEERIPRLGPMFEDRRRQFVDSLGWDVAVTDGRYEIDAFDDDRAVYLVERDGQGHRGSMRLLPTMVPHLLDTHFAHLCAGPVPRDPATFEITRLCLPSRLGAAGRLATRNRLITAMVDLALADAITRLTGVVSAQFREEVLAMGWRAEALGPAVPIASGRVGAFLLHIDADVPERLAANGIYQMPSMSAHGEPVR